MKKLKERRIYYNNARNTYYFVLSVDGSFVYGRCGEILNPTFLDSYKIMSSKKGISFKIDDIIINSNYIKNYNYHYDDPRELDSFKFIKELSDKDYFIMKTFIGSLVGSDYYDDLNNIIVDLNKCDDDLLNLALEID